MNMKSNVFLAALPSYDNRVVLTQKILACEAKRSPLAKVNWSHTDELHITLGFIPSIEENEFRKIALALTEVSRNAPFMAHTSEVRAYGNALVLRMEPHPHFLSIHRKMNQALLTNTEQQYQFDTQKRFDPHITVGRIRNLDSLNLMHRQQLLSLVAEQFQNVSFLIQQAALLRRSPRSQSLPAYETLQLYPLNGTK